MASNAAAKLAVRAPSAILIVVTEASLNAIVAIAHDLTRAAVIWIAMSLSSLPAMAQERAVAAYAIHDGAIEQPLGGLTGDPVRGRIIAAGRRGNCLACHPMPIPEEGFQGNIGPDLRGVGGRYEAGELRLRLVDATRINPDTIMPPFHRIQGLNRVKRALRGKPILTAQEIEDVLAYLLTLKRE
jgi:sulfur-oxidizing protein SoxX